MIYRTECTQCHKEHGYKSNIDFSSTLCPDCGAKAFGVIQYKETNCKYENSCASKENCLNCTGFSEESIYDARKRNCMLIKGEIKGENNAKN